MRRASGRTDRSQGSGGTLVARRWPADDPDAPPVVAAHGNIGNGLSWARVADHLDGAMTVRSAQPARGRAASAAVEGPYGMAAHGAGPGPFGAAGRRWRRLGRATRPGYRRRGGGHERPGAAAASHDVSVTPGVHRSSGAVILRFAMNGGMLDRRRHRPHNRARSLSRHGSPAGAGCRALTGPKRCV